MLDARMRTAAPDDLKIIETIVRDAYGKYLERIGKPPAPMMADYGRLIGEGDVWVLELDGRLVGLIGLKSATDYLLIDNVAVSPAQQGRGFGSRLLTFAETQARERGFEEMRLFTNELMHENIDIYRKLGWIEYGRIEQDGYRRVLMRKEVEGRRSDARTHESREKRSV